MSDVTQYAPLITVSPLLLYAGLEDLRHLRIPNWLVLSMMGVFLLTAPVLALSEIGMRLLAAGAILLICIVLFCWRVVAGGDVKMLAAALLFVPSSALGSFGWSFSVSLVVAVAAVTALRRASPLTARLRWAVMDAPGSLPMGIAISMALAIFPAIRWITA